jgi:hypothetical protein
MLLAASPVQFHYSKITDPRVECYYNIVATTNNLLVTFVINIL